jgi:microtubule-associated protein 1
MTLTVAKKVKDKVEETVVTVTDKTKIMKGAEKKTLADVKAGEKVTVKYTEKEGKNTAKSISIQEKKAEATKAAEPAKAK